MENALDYTNAEVGRRRIGLSEFGDWLVDVVKYVIYAIGAL